MRSLIKDFITQNLHCEQFLHHHNTTTGPPCQHGVCRSFVVSVCSAPDFYFWEKIFWRFSDPGGVILAVCFLSVNRLRCWGKFRNSTIVRVTLYTLATGGVGCPSPKPPVLTLLSFTYYTRAVYCVTPLHHSNTSPFIL